MKEADKSWFGYFKRRFRIKFGKQLFLLLEVKTCDSIYTKMESQPSQKTEYAHLRKQ